MQKLETTQQAIFDLKAVAVFSAWMNCLDLFSFNEWPCHCLSKSFPDLLCLAISISKFSATSLLSLLLMS